MKLMVALVLVGVAMIAAGVTWWFGPLGLVLSGFAVAAAGLTIDTKE